MKLITGITEKEAQKFHQFCTVHIFLCFYFMFFNVVFLYSFIFINIFLDE